MLKLKPYRIIPDPLSMYHYLIGYAVPESDSPESEPYSYSCRISNLKYIKMLHEKSFITQNDKKSLEKELQKKGSQFMIGELCEARIYLTRASACTTESGIFARNIRISPRTDIPIPSSAARIRFIIISSNSARKQSFSPRKTCVFI